ncbi:hypothetical protein OG216_46380 (plasmid) [Streptomycetaceae bacterium NBC_01309]
MRKRTLATTLGLLCAFAATACSAPGADRAGARDFVALSPAGPVANSATPPAVAEPTAPPTAAPPGASHAAALSAARDKVRSAQTCRGEITVYIGETKISTSQIQLRMGGAPFARLVTTTEAAYFQSLGQPVPPEEDRRTETIVTPTSVYSSNGPEVSQLYNGKAWTMTTLAARDGNGGQPQDFASQLALLKRSGDVREVGTEMVDGVQATHYSGTISLALLYQNTAESTGMSEKEYAMLRQLWEALRFENVQIELWVGPDGLPVKQTTITTTKSSGSPVASITSTTRYLAWGVPIDESLPPAEDTMKLQLP